MLSMFKLGFATVTVAACVLFQFATASYELEELQEKTCGGPDDPPFPGDDGQSSPNVDREWIKSVKMWYYVQGSKMDLYQTAARGYYIPVNQVKETDVYYRICNQYTWDGMDNAKAWINSKLIPFNQNMSLTDGILYWNMKHGDTATGQGRSTMPYTDNKSYILFYTCWQDGSVTWGVMASSTALSEQATKEVQDWARAHGFNEKYFGILRYEPCDPPIM